MLIDSTSTSEFVNDVFVGNTAVAVGDSQGGAVGEYGGADPSFIGDTLVDNTSTNTDGAGALGGASFAYDDSSATVVNSIIWNNSAATGADLFEGEGGSGVTSVSYSDIGNAFGTTNGTEVISVNPLFVSNPSPGPDGIWGTADDNYGNLMLQAGSPAINIGSNAAVPTGSTTDAEGNPRIQGGVVDLGAYESTQSTWINPAGGYWDVASNWSGDVLPTATSSVYINTTAGASITVRTGTATAASIYSNNPVNLSGGTLAVTGTIQINSSFNMSGGTLQGATIVAGTGTVINAHVVNLAEVTLDTPITLGQGSVVTVYGGLVLNSTINMTAGGGSNADLVFSGSQALSGVGQIVLGGISGGTNYILSQGGGTSGTGAVLTIGSGITIAGPRSGQIEGFYSQDSIIENGVINANGSGQTITINSLTNQGVIQTNGGILSGAISSGIYNAPISVGNLSLSGASIDAPITIGQGDTLNISGLVYFTSTITLTAGGGSNSYLIFDGTQTISGYGSIIFGGTTGGTDLIYAQGGDTASTGATVTIGSGITLSGPMGGSIQGYYSQDTFLNTGVINANGSGQTITVNSLTNQGTIQTNGGLLSGTITGGTFQAPIAAANLSLIGATVDAPLTVQQNDTLQILSGLTLNSSITLSGGGGSNCFVVFLGTQTLSGTGQIILGGISGGTDFVVAQGGNSSSTGATLTIGPNITLSGAENGVVEGRFSEDAIINQGTLEATGGALSIGDLSTSTGKISAIAEVVTFTGNLLNTGTISIGAAGTIKVQGTFTQSAAGTLDVTLGGTSAGQYGVLTAQGSATLAGTLNISESAGFSPANANTFPVLAYSAETGQFGTINGLIISSGTQLVATYGNSAFTLTTDVLPEGTWINPAGGYWDVAANWSNGIIPQPADNVVIGNTSGPVILRSGTYAISSITSASLLNISGGTLTVSGSASLASLNVTAGTIDFVSNAAVGNVNLSAGTIAGSGIFTVNGSMTWINGTLDMAGKAVISTGASLTIGNYSQPEAVLEGVLETDGPTLFQGNGEVSFNSGTINNYGTWTATTTAGNDLFIGNSNAGQTDTFNNLAGSTFDVPGPGDVFIYDQFETSVLTFNNAGTLNVSGGVLETITGTGTTIINTGTITVAPTASVLINGDYSQATTGMLDLTLGGTTNGHYSVVTVTGIASLAGTLNIAESGGFVPAAGSTFPVLTFSSNTGQFTTYGGLAINANNSLLPVYNPKNLTLQVVQQNPADLTVTGVSITPTSPVSGQNVTINWSDTNTGAGTAVGTWNDQISVVNTTTGITVYSANPQFTNNSIATGGSVARSAAFILPAGNQGAGPLLITITTDSGQTIQESNAGGTGYTNNTTTLNATSTLAPSPDLVVQALSVNPPNPQSGGNVIINWYDANSGNATASGTWTDTVTVINTSTGATLYSASPTFSGNSIIGGSYAARSASFTMPQGNAGTGNLSVSVTVDSNEAIAEYNPAGTGAINNTTTITTSSTIAQYPDLVVAGLQLAPTNPVSSQAVTVAWYDANIGAASAVGAWYDQITVVNTTTGQTIYSGQSYYSGNSETPGSSVARSVGFTLPNGTAGVGQLSISVTVNSTGSLYEYNATGTATSNDTSTATATSTLGGYPDLVVSGVGLSLSAPVSGQTVAVDWTDNNSGTAAANGGWYDHVVVINTTTGQTIFDDQDYYSSNLGTNGTVARSDSFKLPDGPAGAGDLSIAVTVNSTNSIYESNAAGTATTNNTTTATATSTLAAYPDLAVTGIGLSDPAPVSGETVSINWNDANISNTTARGNWYDQVTVINTTTGQTLFTAQPYFGNNILPGNDSLARSVSFTLPNGTAGVGTLSVSVTVNSTASLYEFNAQGNASGNNTSVATFTSSLAVSPDLTTSVQTPAAAVSGTSISVSFTVTNSNAAAAQGSWMDTVSLVPVGGGASYLLGQLSNPESLTAGGSYTRTANFTLPANISGAYTISVVANSSDSLYESNFGNNTGTSGTFNVSLAPYAELEVKGVGVPSTVTAGSLLTVNWSVGNYGTGGTSVSTWYDAVYISLNPDALDSSAIYLGQVQNPGYLGVNESYNSSLTAALPTSIPQGTYYAYVHTNVTGSQPEYNYGTNNIVRSSLGVQIQPINNPALFNVSSVKVSTTGSVYPGGLVSVTYTVTNNGGQPITGTWYDGLALSPRDQYDAAGAQDAAVDSCHEPVSSFTRYVLHRISAADPAG